MVSKAIASLDAWLAQADAVLRDQREQSISPSSVQRQQENVNVATVTMATFEVGLIDLLRKFCYGPGRWILICRVVGSANQFWQAMTYEDGSLIVEVVSNGFLEGNERYSAEDEDRLTYLGWTTPCPPTSPNWRRVEETISPPVEDVAQQALRTLREVFSVGPEDPLEIVTFESLNRENTPASQSVLAEALDSQAWCPSAASDPATDSDHENTGRVWTPTTEPWAPYFRQLWSDYLTPPSAFISWKYRTTGKNIAVQMWEVRQRLRAEWKLRYGSNPGSWPLAHPPAVLWMPYAAHAACLSCSWLDDRSGSILETAGRRAKKHSIAEGCDPDFVTQIQVPVGERGGPIDEPLGISWVR